MSSLGKYVDLHRQYVMLNFHEHKFTKMDAFQINIEAALKNLEAQVDQHVQELKEQPTMTHLSDTLTNFNESMDISLSTTQGLPI